MNKAVLVAASVLAIVASSRSQTTVIRGRIVAAMTREPIAGVVVKVGDDSAFTDATGQYELRASRTSDWLGIRKGGWLDFEQPLLQLSTDTLFFDAELRSDPPSEASYLGQQILPYLCVRQDDAAHLEVTNSCRWPTYPEGAYARRIIKHNPWNPYFGRAGDHGGVVLASRVR